MRAPTLLATLGALLSLLLGARARAGGRADPMTVVGPGALEVFEPPSPDQAVVHVHAYRLQKRPVTNAEFLAFVKHDPAWQRGRVSPLFADARYLAHWQTATVLGPNADPDAPVVGVSWFAAKAYCEARGERLPTENEWELAAAASETSPNAGNDPAWTERLLAWYSHPTPSRLGKVGQGRPNYWGVYDLHGLIWEWVYDYNAQPPAGEGQDGTRLACGGPPASPEDRANYAKFMRHALRAALLPAYTASSLGFRCAADIQGGAP